MTLRMRLISPTLRCSSSIVFAVLTVSSCVALIPSTVRCTASPPPRASSRTCSASSAVDWELVSSSLTVESISATNDSTSSPIPARTWVRFEVSVMVAFICVADDDVFSTDWKR